MTGRQRFTRALFALAVTALALPAAARAGDVRERATAQSRAEVVDYWTPARMAAARPAAELLRGVDPGALPPVRGERGAPLRVGAVGPELSGGGRQRRAAAEVSKPSRAPIRTHGKVFLTLGGTNYVCSGTVVRSKIRRLVLSAGHCVYDAQLGGFATNWMFVPAYDDGSEPFGRWTARKLATTSRWADSTKDSNSQNDDVRYDAGFATIKAKKRRKLQNVVGARGLAFNISRNRSFSAFGYPARPPFDGQRLYVCNSFGEGPDTELAPPQPTRIDCDMTAGSSGGGWVISSGRVNSVVSYSYEPGCPFLCSDPDGDKLYGPYFGETIKSLWRSQRKRSRRR